MLILEKIRIPSKALKSIDFPAKKKDTVKLEG